MTKTDNFEIKLLNTIKKYDMFSSEDRVLVGLSGGKDSVALLYALKSLSPYLGITVKAFHLNHGIRGKEADSDMEFAEKLCDVLSVPFYSERADIPSMAKDCDVGLEAIARDVRYSALDRVCIATDCNKIATAHTASDNSETVIMTLMRNSCPRGIPPVRNNIVRPLIMHTTEEVLDYCKRHNLLYVTDSTNLDDNYTRNYVRHKILPSIYQLFPSFDDTVANYADMRHNDDMLIDDIANKYLSENENPMQLSSLSELANSPAYRSVLHRVLTLHFKADINFKQFSGIVSLILSGNTGQRIVLVGDKYVLRDYNELKLCKKSDFTEDFHDFQIELKYGRNPIPQSPYSIWVESPEDYKLRQSENIENKKENLNVHKITKNISTKYNIIVNSLIARSRKSGDAFVCRGITRSVKKFMIDEKIPSELRSRIPIVCDEKGIVWVPGLGTADRINTADKDCYVLSLDFELTDVER